MREKILDVLEKNGRIDLKEMAIMLGYSEAEVANEIADMEKDILSADIMRSLTGIRLVKRKYSTY